MNETIIITKYIAAWMWHVIGMIFLATALVSAMLNKIPYIIGLAFVAGFCEFMALKRKNEIYGGEE